MRWKWLSLLLVCQIPKIGQYTRDPVCYCLCQPIGPRSPGRRGLPPRLPAEGISSSSAGRWGGPFQPGLFGPIGWNGWGEKTAPAVRNRISSVLANFGHPADEEEWQPLLPHLWPTLYCITINMPWFRRLITTLFSLDWFDLSWCTLSQHQ